MNVIMAGFQMMPSVAFASIIILCVLSTIGLVLISSDKPTPTQVVIIGSVMAVLALLVSLALASGQVTNKMSNVRYTQKMAEEYPQFKGSFECDKSLKAVVVTGSLLLPNETLQINSMALDNTSVCIEGYYPEVSVLKSLMEQAIEKNHTAVSRHP